MKPDRHNNIGSSVWLLMPCRAVRALQAAAIALLLGLQPGAGTANAMAAAPSASDAHVYLLRGVLNIFSLGLDDIAAKLQAQGITVTVANYLSWASLADEAAAEYRKLFELNYHDAHWLEKVAELLTWNVPPPIRDAKPERGA